ncbi:MAG: metallophosphoesterase [Eubacteriaceae bacterium]|nr:metallophosphoesterase [Eubacteriaceae bacterium]
MKLLIFSDSHSDTSLIKKAIENHPDITAILHAGDYARDMNRFYGRGLEIYRVKGNCDRDDPFDEELLLEFEGVRLLLCHGHEYSVKYTNDELYARASQRGAACAVFGHTHQSLVTSKGGILLFNPGTANGKKRSNGASYGILEIKGGEVVSAKIRGENEN